MELTMEDLAKLLLAVLVGGVIGAEREYRDKAAGLRTVILISLGACLFAMFSLKIGGAANGDRIAANIVSGVGFLGAGAILRDGSRVTGLTTAATIWLSAALGLGIGGGYFPVILVATALAFTVLFVFPLFERRIDRMRDQRQYQITCAFRPTKARELEDMIVRCRLRVASHTVTKKGQELNTTWQVLGPPESHARLIEALAADPDIREFTV